MDYVPFECISSTSVVIIVIEIGARITSTLEMEAGFIVETVHYSDS